MESCVEAALVVPKMNHPFDISGGPSGSWSHENGEVGSYKSVGLLNEAWPSAWEKLTIYLVTLVGFEIVVVDHKSPLGQIRRSLYHTVWVFSQVV